MSESASVTKVDPRCNPTKEHLTDLLILRVSIQSGVLVVRRVATPTSYAIGTRSGLLNGIIFLAKVKEPKGEDVSHDPPAVGHSSPKIGFKRSALSSPVSTLHRLAVLGEGVGQPVG
jgi:hypothetical protein